MDARSYFLSLHRHAHGEGSPTAQRVLNDATPAQQRLKLPGHNTVAWNIWHIARGEDWAVNAMLRGKEQLLTRDYWNARLGISRLDFGAGMTENEVADLSQNIDLDGLKAYFTAVTAETRRFVETYDLDQLDEPIDVVSRLAQAPEAFTPGGDIVRSMVERLTTGRWFLTVMALYDVALHVSEASHVLRLIAPERRWA